MEGIEEDREILKRMKKMDRDSVDEAYSKSMKQKRINYIRNLIAMSLSLNVDEQGEPNRMSLKIRNMSTRNILFAVSESFKNVNKKIIKKLERIKEELMERNDLFECVLDHMETMDILEDDFYSWYPGLKTCNIFGFVLDLVPDILERYKEYFIRSLVTQQQPRRKMLDVFRDRLNKNLQCFDVFERDMALFKEFSGDLPPEGLIITASYWSDEEVRCKEVLKFFPQIKDRMNLSPNIYIELFHTLSYTEVSINGRDMIVSFVQLDDLLTKNNRSLEFWVKSGVVDEDWEYC